MKADIFGKATGAIVKKIGAEKLIFLRKNQPKMMLIGGLALIGVGVVSACRGTLKTEDSVDEFKEQANYIHNASKLLESDKKDITKAKAENIGKLCLNTARNYAPAVICIGSGVALIVGSHNIMQSRIGMLSAAYISLDEAYKGYRQRVIDAEGEEADRKYCFGVEKKEITEEKQLKNGKTKEQKKVVNYIHSDGRPYSPYARFFDAYNSPTEYRNDPGYNDMFLRSQQAIANEQFQKKGHLFLNDVYKMLGMAETPEGQLVGWYQGMGDDFVDFGLLECYNEAARDYVNGSTECFVLDFNVDGPIWDLL